MLEIDIRPTVANDLSRLMGFDHSVTSESVWQLELRREPGQVNASFREVRLPRSISIEYPHNPFALADDWVRKSMMYTGLVGQDPVGYISMLERGAASVVTSGPLGAWPPDSWAVLEPARTPRPRHTR